MALTIPATPMCDALNRSSANPERTGALTFPIFSSQPDALAGKNQGEVWPNSFELGPDAKPGSAPVPGPTTVQSNRFLDIAGTNRPPANNMPDCKRLSDAASSLTGAS